MQPSQPLDRALDRFESTAALSFEGVDSDLISRAIDQLHLWHKEGRDDDLAEALGVVGGLSVQQVEAIRDEAKNQMLSERTRFFTRDSVQKMKPKVIDPVSDSSPRHSSPWRVLGVFGFLVVSLSGVGLLLSGERSGPRSDGDSALSRFSEQGGEKGESQRIVLRPGKTAEAIESSGASGKSASPSTPGKRTVRLESFLQLLEESESEKQLRDVRKRLIQALKRDPQLLAVVIKWLKNPGDRDVQSGVLRALVEWGSEESISALVELCRGGVRGGVDPVLVLEQFRYLSFLSSTVLQMLSEQTRSQDEVLSGVAFELMGELGHRFRSDDPGRAREIAQELARSARAPGMTSQQKADALHAMGRIGEESSIDALGGYTRSEEAMLRATAMRALSAFEGDKRVFEWAKRGFREDEDEGVVLACGEVLAHLSGPELEGFLRREFEENTRQVARAFSLIHLAEDLNNSSLEDLKKSSLESWLLEVARTDRDPDIRRLARDLLGDGDRD
ncbi:MAG: HEAT repeat domain-containing protein [Planctomycetota bacterium]|nr:HEAT repeat domain-containing protein [Planctomycetota bacterium]